MGFVGFLVKRRNILLAVMTALAVVCGVMIPRLNIIMEITYFLPDDSPIKQGLDRMEKSLPGLNGQLNMLSVMLEDVSDKEAEEKVLTELTEGLICLEIKDNTPYTLYRFLLTSDSDYELYRKAVKEHYDGNVVVEVDMDKNMPADIIPMIVSGTLLVFLILLIMCSSLMEVVLFLVTTLIAVSINMGSNILMEGVSYMTNTMTAVLQMILSMDYSIIIMNRFKQEKANFPGDNPKAMETALQRAAPSVLSSATTTIASLMMLVFMHLKIGMDMGFVLSKGVLCSMICNFTVLPALILLFDKAIVKTEKKIPVLPTGRLARFEVKNRIVLSVLFVGIFITAFFLQKRTEISFSAIWETEIAKQFPPRNPMVLMYETAEEDAVPAILDTLQRDHMVANCLSYPGLVKRGYSIEEMTQQFGQLSPLISEDIVRAVYYSYSHPERKERLSLNEIQELAEDLDRQGLLPDGFDVKGTMSKFIDAGRPVVPPPAVPVTPPDTIQVSNLADSISVVPITDSVAVEPPAEDSTSVAQPAAPEPPKSATISLNPDGSVKVEGTFSYEQVSEQLTAKEFSARYGIERSYVNTLYRIAGRTRKPATMTPHEILMFVNSKLLNDRRYSGLLTKEQATQFRELYRQIDSAFVAGPAPKTELLAEASGPLADSLSTAAASADSIALLLPAPADSVLVAQAGPVPEEKEEEEDPEPELSPVERLAQMSLSGLRYNSRTVRNALTDAGIPVTQEDMDLLYLYAGSRKWKDDGMRMSIGELVNYLDGTLLQLPAFARFIDDDSREKLAEAKEQLDMAASTMRSEDISVAAVLTDYKYESPETFSFLDRFQKLSDRSLKGDHVIIAESAMYKEISEEFPDEMLLLTILTVISIFLIVALTFRSLIIPVMLILAVMSGVYVNVFVSGLGGNTMYFMAYLIVQSILMGATIDYTILFTSYYRENRLRTGVPGSIRAAYSGAGHSIMTSGLILTLAPFTMSMFIKDQMVASILKCLASGALSAILVIFLALPGMIALCDVLVAPKGAVKSFGNK